MFSRISSFVANRLIQKSVKNQCNNSLSNLSLWGLNTDERGIISVAGQNVIDLVRQFGSPLLVVNNKKLNEDANDIRRALETHSPGSKVLYSYKTNCIPGILSELHRQGVGAEVISPYELWLAEKLGVRGDDIVFNGVNKTDDSLKQAIDLDVFAINIDCHDEIDRIYRIAQEMNKKARVGIRLGFVEKTQFGLEVSSGEAMAACLRIAELSDHLQLTCIHFCVTSNAKDSSTHKTYALKSLELIAEIRAKTGLEVGCLDLGGGYGVPTTKNMSGIEYGSYRMFGALPDAPDPSRFQGIDAMIADIASAISSRARELNMVAPKLILEPGRFITSRAEFLLSTVLSIKVKQRGHKFAITDAGRLSTTFPCDFEYHQVFLADQNRCGQKSLYQVMGRICTSADWMVKNLYLPQLQPGDILATMDAGAYFSSYSSNFAFPRPAVIMVNEKKVNTIRMAESFDHLTALDAWGIEVSQ